MRKEPDRSNPVEPTRTLLSAQWYVNDVLVDGHEFPVYSWVLDNESQIAFTGKAHLPQDTPPGLRHWRRLKLIQNQDLYDYQPVSFARLFWRGESTRLPVYSSLHASFGEMSLMDF